MNGDWQSYAAGLVVLATAVIFAVGIIRRRKSGGGCTQCHGCSVSRKPDPKETGQPAAR